MGEKEGSVGGGGGEKRSLGSKYTLITSSTARWRIGFKTFAPADRCSWRYASLLTRNSKLGAVPYYAQAGTSTEKAKL